MSGSSVAFFPNAQHSTINFHKSVDIVNGNTINNHLRGPYGSELQQLIHYCLLGALVDSKEQYDTPQCEPETRVAMTQEIDDWGRAKSARLMWARGGAGAGKSTLAQTIAMKYKRKGLLVGSFFFSNRKRNRSDGNALILTLVLQLMVVFPAIAPNILRVIKENPIILTSSPEEHMKHLFVGPLNALDAMPANPLTLLRLWFLQLGRLIILAVQISLGSLFGNDQFCTTPKPQPCLIVIDGLDECDDPEMQTKLLHIIGDAIPKISQPFRFLITSRPEAYITRAFEQDEALNTLNVQQLDLSAARDADRDIELYLRNRFAAIRRNHPFGEHLPKNWPSNHVLRKLVRVSSGHFIYPSTIMAFINDPNDIPHRLLVAALDSTKQSSTHNSLAPLDALYQHIFSRIKENHLPAISTYIGIVSLESHGPSQVRGVLGRLCIDRHTMDDILQLEKGHLDVMIQPLRSLIVLPPYPSHDRPTSYKPTMRSYHASLFDFLFEPARSDQFHVDLGLAHKVLAEYLIRHVVENQHFWTHLPKPSAHRVVLQSSEYHGICL